MNSTGVEKNTPAIQPRAIEPTAQLLIAILYDEQNWTGVVQNAKNSH
jgi:hypothetical protein